jgi:hypothetical protein
MSVNTNGNMTEERKPVEWGWEGEVGGKREEGRERPALKERYQRAVSLWTAKDATGRRRKRN